MTALGIIFKICEITIERNRGVERIKALLHTAVIIVIYFLADAFSIEALSFVFVKSGSFLLGEMDKKNCLKTK